MRLRRSIDIVSGIVMMRRLPRAAAIAARPISVLPEVGSMSTVPSFTLPAFTASSIIAFAMRSFTDCRVEQLDLAEDGRVEIMVLLEVRKLYKRGVAN